MAGDGSGGGRNKFTIIGLCAILLVAMVVAVAIGVSCREKDDDDTSGKGQLATSNKAIQSMCMSTDYKDACVKSLASAKNNTDPTQLVKVAFQATIKDIKDAVKSSSTFKEASEDPRTKDALKLCSDLLDTAIGDLNRSISEVDEFEFSKMDEYAANIKTWLSASITYQETCKDAFENTTGVAGDKMKKALKAAGELSSNGLAIVTELSQAISSLQIDGISHRVLSDQEPNTEPRDHHHNNAGESETTTPSWMSKGQRVLVQSQDTQATPIDMKPTVVVAQDGSGKFKTITEAINAAPKKSNTSYVILVKAGTYNEHVEVPKHADNIVLLGEGPKKTRITGRKNFAEGTGTYRTATIAINADFFFAKDIGFENTAGAEKHQAVALRVSGDRAVFYNCHVDGYQDTLYAHSYRQFYRECTITGTIDFIFGDAAVVFQNCKIVVRRPMDNQACMVTAQGRKEHRETSAIVLQNCQITAEKDLASAQTPAKVYLGRPWKEFSRTIVIQSEIHSIVDPEGWSKWQDNFALDTCWYAEYNNRGPGSDKSKRVKWKGIKKITEQGAERFLPEKFFTGDVWIKRTGIPYDSGFSKV